MSNLLLNDIDNSANLKRWEQLIFEAERTAKLIEINKRMTEAALEFNAIKNAVNNLDYSPSKTVETNIDKTEEIQKVETIADKIDEYKNETLSKSINLAEIVSKTNTNEETKAEETEKQETEAEGENSWTKIDLSKITWSSDKKEESEEEIKAKILLKEANEIEEENNQTPANNQDYKSEENEEKATGTNWPKIDINNLL